MQRLSIIAAVLCSSLVSFAADAAPPRGGAATHAPTNTILTVHWVDTAPSGARLTQRYTLSLGSHGASSVEVRGADRRLEIRAKRVGSVDSGVLEFDVSRHLTPTSSAHTSLRAQVIARIAPGRRAQLVQLHGADGTVTNVHAELR